MYWTPNDNKKFDTRKKVTKPSLEFIDEKISGTFFLFDDFSFEDGMTVSETKVLEKLSPFHSEIKIYFNVDKKILKGG